MRAIVSVPVFALRGVSFFFVLAATSPALAGGFYIQEQSASAMGTAYAGAGATARDASVMYYNPAGLTGLGGRQIAVGASVLEAWADNRDRGSTVGASAAGGRDSDDPIPTSVIPNAYAAMPVGDRFWIGLGVSAPFGLAMKYNSDWYGRFDSIKSVLKVIDIQPTVAWKAADWLSIGGGVNIQHADATLSNAVSNGAATGSGNVKGTDWSAGYNLGILLKPAPGTAVGLDYRSKVTHTLDGTIDIMDVPGLNENSGGKADLDLPDIAGLSLSQDMGRGVTLLGQVNYFNWDRFNAITVLRDDGTVAESIAENYRSTWSVALGAEYALGDAVTLRAGYQFDQTPTRDRYRDTRVPDGDRNNVAAGAGIAIAPDLTLNAAAMATFIADENVSVSRNQGLASVKAERGDSTILLGSVGLTYKF